MCIRDRYDEVLNDLKDSVDLKSNSISKSAIKYYTSALLAKGDTIKAIPFITKAIDIGENEHAYALGEIYYNGNQVEQNYTKAKRNFEASLNDARSETMLGNIYFMGLGEEKNYEKAFKHYENAAKKGNSTAMYALGLAYLNGAGIEKNSLEAKIWFQKAIAKNDDENVIILAKKELNTIELSISNKSANKQISNQTPESTKKSNNNVEYSADNEINRIANIYSNDIERYKIYIPDSGPFYEEELIDFINANKINTLKSYDNFIEKWKYNGFYYRSATICLLYTSRCV